MASQWDPRSTELSPWVKGIINGENGNMKFAFVFCYDLSAILRDRDDLHIGQTVRMRIRGRGNFNPTFSSQHDVEEVFVIPKEPSLLEIERRKNCINLKALMKASLDRNGRPSFYNSFIGGAYDTDNIIPVHIIRQEKTVVVSLLAKKDRDDKTKCYLKIVEYFGLSDVKETTERPAESVREALVRRSDRTYHYAWCSGFEKELKIQRELNGPDWLGKWISFKSTQEMLDASIQIMDTPKLLEKHSKDVQVVGHTVLIWVNCQPLRVLNSVQIYETEGVGNICDTLRILDKQMGGFPRFLWLEPETSHPTCLWRISSKKAQDRPAEEQVSFYTGCIITANNETCWIWSKNFAIDVLTCLDLIDHIKSPIGKWVFFPEPITAGNKIRSRGPITFLEKDPIKTRIRRNVPELEVICTRYVENEHDGSRVLWSEEVGEVLVTGLEVPQQVNQLQLPFTAWVVKNKDKDSMYRSRWKVSYENDFRAPRPLANTPSNTSHIGCITTVLGEIFFIWCKDFDRDVLGGVELINDLKTPLGTWIRFPSPSGPPNKLRTRGPVIPLQQDMVNTRVVGNVPEFEVNLRSQEVNETDGMAVYWTEEFGEIIDCDNILSKNRLNLPINVWVVGHRNENHRSRWMIRSPTDRKPEINDSKRYMGIIVNETDDLCWVLSAKLPRNTALRKGLLENPQNVLGKWIEFSVDSTSETRPIAVDPVELKNDIYPTRLFDRITEIQVEIFSFAGRDSEGRRIVDCEVGQVVDNNRFVLEKATVSFPFKCWIAYVKDKAGMPSWKISQKNDLEVMFAKKPNHLQLQKPEAPVKHTVDYSKFVLYDSDDEEEPEHVPAPTISKKEKIISEVLYDSSDEEEPVPASVYVKEQQRSQYNSSANCMISEERQSSRTTPISRQHTPLFKGSSKSNSMDKTPRTLSSPFDNNTKKADIPYDKKSLRALSEEILQDEVLVNAFKKKNRELYEAFTQAVAKEKH